MDEVALTVDIPPARQHAVFRDQVCDRFEAAWKAVGADTPRPRIEDYLLDTGQPELAALVDQLVLLDVDYRRLHGETPAQEDYAPRFPGLSSRLLTETSSGTADSPAVGRGEKVSPAPGPPRPPSERYQIRQFHARGGIGEVWLAEDTGIGRHVALKRLRDRREDQHERFLVEARITGQLEHPGIVPVHDLGVDAEGCPFYVMTFIRGRTLGEVISEYHTGDPAAKDPPEVLRRRLLEIFVKVCEAVAYAHNRGVIHRDLKPDNVMLGPYGETLVLDWGLAKVLNHPNQPAGTASAPLTNSTDSSRTQAGLVMGSPLYMAPEMAAGRAADADERTDVYLLGATLYHILTGRAPRQGRTFHEVVESARNVVPPLPRKVKADVARPLEAICRKAMAHESRDRYAGALEVAADVQCYLAGEPVAAYPEPVLARSWRWCKRHHRALTRSLAGAAVIAVTLAGTVLVHGALQEEAVLRRAAQEGEEESRREAETLRRREEIRRNLAAFRRLTDERQFYSASTTPVGDRSFQYDPQRGHEVGEKAIALGDELVAAFEQLPALPEGARDSDERPAFDKHMHDLLLLIVQAQSRQSPGPETIRAMLRRLDRAASLQKPSSGYHRLRASCYQLLGDTRKRDEETKRADDAGLAATALDHFLLAEQARVEAASPATGHADATTWQPIPERVNRAVEHYRAALRIEPDHYWCHFQLGRCHLMVGKGAEAVEALGTCVALRPKSPWGYSARGMTLGLTRRYAEGEADLDRALSLEPDFRPALLNRGVLAWKQRKIDRALEDFGKALEPPDARRLIEAAYCRGLLYAEQGKYRESLADFDLVAREAPDFRFVYLSRAQIHFLNDDPRGFDDLTAFLERGLAERPDPKGPILFALRGRLLRHLVPNWGLKPKQTAVALGLARDQLDQAIRRGDRSAAVLDDLGSVLESMNEGANALDIYTRALAATPSRDLEAKILLKRGWIYAQSLGRPQPEKSREAFTAALRLEPHSADARAGLGYLAALGKSVAEAQREVVHALLNGGGDYLALHNLACIYAELSQVEKGQAKQHQDVALALLRRAVELWRRGGAGPNEIDLIRREPSFESLRDLKEFEKLLAP